MLIFELLYSFYECRCYSCFISIYGHCVSLDVAHSASSFGRKWWWKRVGRQERAKLWQWEFLHPSWVFWEEKKADKETSKKQTNKQIGKTIKKKEGTIPYTGQSFRCKANWSVFINASNHRGCHRARVTTRNQTGRAGTLYVIAAGPLGTCWHTLLLSQFLLYFYPPRLDFNSISILIRASKTHYVVNDAFSMRGCQCARWKASQG